MTTERDFAAWLDRRDADALARVFDATGGNLLLLAAHLAGAAGGANAGAQAQDLVQATFVAAMAHGVQWDRARPLWPWLAAILHNEARMAVRRSRRRREVALDAADGAVIASGSPLHAAATDEALAAVVTAIDALPLPYRQVLRLRLVHGLRPVDIARSLEVPVGTVRAQLHRGLQQLREALPAGVAGALALLVTGDDALLAQIRERVLEHAAGPSAAAAGALGAARAAAAGGWWAMNGKIVGAVVAGCVVLCCLALATGLPRWLGEPPVGASAARLEHAPVATGGESAAARDSTERRAVDAPPEPFWPLTVVVQTRDGKPIPGANVAVATAPTGGVFWNRDSTEFLREPLLAGVTGADGRFRASLDALRERSPLARATTWVCVEASWPHDREHQQLLELPRTSEREPLTATFALDRCRVLTGKVADAAGAAVAGARIGAVRDARVGIGAEASSRRDGAFVFVCPDDPEDWPAQLAVAHAGHGSLLVAVPPRADGDAPVDLGTVVLEPGAVVHGRVVLGDGSPVAGLQLDLAAFDRALGSDLVAIREWLEREGGRRNAALARRGDAVLCRGARTNTLADGTFRFAGVDPDGVFLLGTFGVGASADTIVRPGADPIELRIDKQLITIDVVAEAGEPLPGASVFLDGYDLAERTRRSWNQRPGMPETGQVCGNFIPMGDPDGRRFLLSPFGFAWHVGVRTDRVQPVAVRHDVLPGVHRAAVRVMLREETRFGALHVVAVDEHGAPVRFGVGLKAVGRDLAHNDRRTISPPEGRTWQLPAGPWEVEAVLGEEVLYLHDDGGHARGCQQHVVTIEPGRTTELKLVAPPAGLVAFRLHSARPPGRAWRGLRVEHAGREVALLMKNEDPRYGHMPLHDALFVTKQAFPPGRHRFLVQADGYQPATFAVDVAADALTRARIELFAK